MIRRGLRALSATVVLSFVFAGGASAATPEGQILAVSAPPVGSQGLGGSEVRVLGDDGQVLTPSAAEPLSPGGVALLEFASLPAEFTVEVVLPDALEGSFRAEVKGFESGQVATLDPVTTLIADADRSKARRQVYEMLGIPLWESPDDLANLDEAFDGARYLAAAKAAGGVDALDSRLVEKALDGGHRSFAAPAAATAQSLPVAHASFDPFSVLDGIFENLFAMTKSNLAEIAYGKTVAPIIGWVLASFGLGEEAKPDQLAPVREKLDLLDRRVSELKGSTERANFSNLLHQTDTVTSAIDTAEERLVALTKSTAPSAGRAKFTRTILDYIEAKLTDAPQVFNHQLGTQVPLADNVLKSASRAVAANHRFFGIAQSKEVESVYEYFATYQTQLAVLLTEYYHAKADTFPTEVVVNDINKLKKQTETQRTLLKTPVPVGTVLDTKEGFMWETGTNDARLQQQVNLGDLARINCDLNSCGWSSTPKLTRTGLPGLPFDDWEIPHDWQLAALIHGWSGNSAAEWLNREAGFSPGLVLHGDSHIWVQDDMGTRYRSEYGNNRRWFQFNLFDLRRGQRTHNPNVLEKSNRSVAEWNDYLRTWSRPAVYVRRPATDYYWGQRPAPGS
jgi:hypothetical protein